MGRQNRIRQKVEQINSPSQQREKERYVRNMFDSIATDYDLMNTLISFGMHSFWRDYAVRRLGVFSGARVLDGCAGTADFALAAARKSGGQGLVAGFDFSQKMLLCAKQKIKGQAEAPIFLQRADALCLPYKKNMFDFATVGCGIRNLSDIDQGLRELYRVLKPGGKFGCLDLGRPVIPGYAQLYYFYFFHIVPLIGKLVSKNPEAYGYLPNSLHTFPKQEELQDRMKRAGFINVYFINIAGGAMALHIGQKP
jgi:demethylmenaquinone methyltransferase/2-methoxy-6-polyprenyl-1,4-benzoquinol methylase